MPTFLSLHPQPPRPLLLTSDVWDCQLPNLFYLLRAVCFQLTGRQPGQWGNETIAKLSSFRKMSAVSSVLFPSPAPCPLCQHSLCPRFVGSPGRSRLPPRHPSLKCTALANYKPRFSHGGPSLGIAIIFINRLFTLQMVLSQPGILNLAKALRILEWWRECVSKRRQRHSCQSRLCPEFTLLSLGSRQPTQWLNLRVRLWCASSIWPGSSGRFCFLSF